MVVKPACQFLHGGHLDFGQSVIIKFIFAFTEINYLWFYLVRKNPDENRSHEAARTNAAKLQGIGTTVSQSQRKMVATGTSQYRALGVPDARSQVQWHRGCGKFRFQFSETWFLRHWPINSFKYSARNSGIFACTWEPERSRVADWKPSAKNIFSLSCYSL